MPPVREELLTGPAGDVRLGGLDARRWLDELFKQHSAYIARLVYRLLGREEEVDDVVQDVFFSLFCSLKSIRRPEATRGWLATTAVRIARRRLRVRRFGFLLGQNKRVDPLSLVAQDAAADDRVALWSLHRALEKVSVDARLAWLLHNLEMEGLDQVARALGCSKATAKRRVAEAQREVKKALER